jgi:hypothetical protein
MSNSKNVWPTVLVFIVYKQSCAVCTIDSDLVYRIGLRPKPEALDILLPVCVCGYKNKD